MIEHGYEHCTVRYLNRLHAVASAFPPSARRAEQSWEIHAGAGSPAVLEAVLKAAEAQP
jgi:hypothetical protein